MQTNIQVDDATAVAACRRARADLAAGGERLRHVHEAGRLLRAVARSKGGRNVSGSLTRLQTITREAGISRETANAWQQVGDVPTADLETFIGACEAARTEITIAGLLKTRQPKGDERACMVSLGKLSDRQRERFKHEIAELRATFGTETDGEAVVEAVRRLYADILSRRCAA